MLGHVDLYSDGRNKVCEVVLYSKYGIGIYRFLFHNEELISYGGVWDDRFYIKHFGKEIKGRVVEGRRFGVKKGEELEIEVKEGYFSLRLDYIPFGSRLTPLIKVKRSTWQYVILPEFDKVYKGKDVNVVGKSWGLQVEELGSDKFRVYMLMLDGKEYLVYEGQKHLFTYYYSLEFSKAGNVMVVELNHVDQHLKECFFKVPELSYLFVSFYYRDPPGEKLAKISFDLDNWVEVKARKMIFKRDAGLRFEYRIDVDRWISKRTSNEIRKAFEEIRSNLIKEPWADLTPSLGG